MMTPACLAGEGQTPERLFEKPGNLSRHSEAEADRITHKCLARIKNCVHCGWLEARP
jgi:hypothetical protein